MSVRGNIAVGAAYLAAVAGPPAGVLEIAGVDVLGAEAAGKFVGEQNAGSHNAHVRSCADNWQRNVRAGEIVVGDCLYTLTYGDKTPSKSPDAYVAKHLLKPAQIEERKDTFSKRGGILGGLGSIAVGGVAAGILSLRRMFLKDRDPKNPSGSGEGGGTDVRDFTVAAAVGPFALMSAKNNNSTGNGPREIPVRRSHDPLLGFAVQ